MALQPHPRSAVQQSRARGSPLIPAGHQPLGSDDYPSIEEGRGTPHEPTEGLDPSSCWSDHFNPHDRSKKSALSSQRPHGPPMANPTPSIRVAPPDGAGNPIPERFPLGLAPKKPGPLAPARAKGPPQPTRGRADLGLV